MMSVDEEWKNNPAICFALSVICTNFVGMKQMCVAVLFAVLLGSCGKPKTEREEFRIETVNKTTPVKDQGRSELCWVYAMLATIESDRLMQGDSVNLSPDYVARRALEEQAADFYLSRGSRRISLRGVAPRLLTLIETYGVMPYEAYHADCNYSAVARRTESVAVTAANRREGLGRLDENVNDMLDDAVRPMPRNVYMLGAEYTPVEFAHSVCLPGDYVALTSYTHIPYYIDTPLALPDNRYGEMFYNVPVDTLMAAVEAALRSGRSVCWEGDISEPGFSFAKGTARLAGQAATGDGAQRQRQRDFETFRTTDDHCMELIGIARDSGGGRYFVCKNSWGKDNPYGGLMFMSMDYARLKTVAVVLKADVLSKEMRRKMLLNGRNDALKGE